MYFWYILVIEEVPRLEHKHRSMLRDRVLVLHVFISGRNESADVNEVLEKKEKEEKDLITMFINESIT